MSLLWLPDLVIAQPAQNASQQLQVPADAVGLNVDWVSKLERYREALRIYLSGPDLVDSLYFAEFDRPYWRSTVACLLRVTQALSVEAIARRNGSGYFSDEQVARMLSWADATIAADNPKRRSQAGTFFPNRRHINGRYFSSSWKGTGQSDVLAGVISREDDVIGADALSQLELAACAGFKLFARFCPDGESMDDPAAIQVRSAALGIGLVQFEEDLLGSTLATGSETQTVGIITSSAKTAPVGDSYVVPWITTLQPADVLKGGDRLAALDSPHVLPAISDPPHGESWVNSLARRHLYRCIVDDKPMTCVRWWPVPTDVAQPQQAPAARALIWAHALAGQRVGLFDRWSLVTPTFATISDSVVANPAVMEAFCRTSLELLEFSRYVGRFPSAAEVAVVAGASALAAQGEESFSGGFAGFAGALIDRQIPFDVILPEMLADLARMKRYRAIVFYDVPRISPDALTAVQSLWGMEVQMLSLGNSLAEQPDGVGAFRFDRHAPLADAGPLADVLVMLRAQGKLQTAGIVPVQENGRICPGLIADCVVSTEGEFLVAVVNMTPGTQRIRLQRGGKAWTGQVRDITNNQTLSDAQSGIEISPWGVHLLATHRQAAH